MSTMGKQVVKKGLNLFNVIFKYTIFFTVKGHSQIMYVIFRNYGPPNHLDIFVMLFK